jgi:hypothetical protein
MHKKRLHLTQLAIATVKLWKLSYGGAPVYLFTLSYPVYSVATL